MAISEERHRVAERRRMDASARAQHALAWIDHAHGAEPGSSPWTYDMKEALALLELATRSVRDALEEIEPKPAPEQEQELAEIEAEELFNAIELRENSAVELREVQRQLDARPYDEYTPAVRELEERRSELARTVAGLNRTIRLLRPDVPLWTPEEKRRRQERSGR